MQRLRATDLRGVWGAVLLPIQADDSIDFARLGDIVDRLLATGVDGLYTNGTAGEFFVQTEAEFDQIQELVAARCEEAGRPFQIGASHMDPLIMRDRVRRAATLKPSAIQIILPDWQPLSLDEADAFVVAVAEAAAPVPLVLYNPPHAKRCLDPSALGHLVRTVPAIIGVKVSDGDADWYASIRQHLTDIAVFVPGHHLATGLREGAAGSYSNIACLSPDGAVAWYRLTRRDPAAALHLEERICTFLLQHILPFAREHGCANHALDKLLAVVGDLPEVGLRVRWPHVSAPAAAVPELRARVRRDLPELFAA